MSTRIEIDLAIRAAALQRRAERISPRDGTEKRVVTEAAEDAKRALVEDARARVAAHNPRLAPRQVDRLAEHIAARELADAKTALYRRHTP